MDTEQIWQDIDRSIVDPLKVPNSSYFDYDGYRWKDCGFVFGEDGKAKARCLRIRKS